MKKRLVKKLEKEFSAHIKSLAGRTWIWCVPLNDRHYDCITVDLNSGRRARVIMYSAYAEKFDKVFYPTINILRRVLKKALTSAW